MKTNGTGSMSYLRPSVSTQTAGGAWLVEPSREGACIVRVIQVKHPFPFIRFRWCVGMVVLKEGTEPFAKKNPSITETISANFRLLLHAPTHITSHRMRRDSVVGTATTFCVSNLGKFMFDSWQEQDTVL